MPSERFPVQWHERLAVVTLPDETDLSNAAAIQDGLMSALSQRPAALVVDMTPTTFCDSAGVRAVMLAYKKAAATGCELRLVIGSPAVMRVFTLLGADQLVAIYSGLASALGPVADGAVSSRPDGAAPGPQGVNPSLGGAAPSAERA